MGRTINASSVTAHKGDPGGLIDHSSMEGAVVAFTRSLEKRGIRVNGVAPGPTRMKTAGNRLLVPTEVPARMRKDDRSRTSRMPRRRKRSEPMEDHGMGGVQVGSTAPGTDSLSRMKTSAEVSEEDLSPGQRRRSGEMD